MNDTTSFPDSDAAHRSSPSLARAGLAGAISGVLSGALGLAWTAAPRWGGAALGPLLLAGAGALLGLGVGVGLAALAALRRRLGARGWSPRLTTAVLAGGAALPLLVWLGFLATSGRRAAALPFRPGLVLVAALVGAAGLGALAGAAQTGLRRRGLRAALAALALLAGGAALWADAHLLVRRYAWLHLALQGGAFLCLQAGLLAALSAGPRGAPPARPPSASARVRLAGAALLLGLVATSAAAARRLWATPDGETRAALFAAGGPAATVLERTRPLFARPPARLPAAPAVGMATAPVDAEDLLPAAPRAPFAGMDVVLVTIDAARADHFGFYGYDRAITPNLDVLAQGSAVFDRAYAPTPHTSFSLASLMTGRHAFSLARADRLAGVFTLADAFGAAGYRTFGLFPPAVFYVEGARFKDLEARRYGFSETRYESIGETQDAVARVDQAIEALERARAADEPAFVWLHHFAPHEPYVAHYPPEDPRSFGTRDVDRYDGEIAWVDEQLGRLFDHLRGRDRPAIVVLSADHGEEFGEHGGAYHGTSLYDEQLRIPLLLHLPGRPGRRVSVPVSTVDLAPTLRTLTGLPWRGRFDGADRSALLLGDDPLAEAEPPPVFAEVESWKAIVDGSFKLICDMSRGFCRLFDLAADPGEHTDLAGKRKPEVTRLRAALEAWVRSGPGADRIAALAPESPGSAALWAAQRGDASALEAVRALLAGPEASAVLAERVLAARLLARAPGAADRPALRMAWQTDEEPTVRLWAAIALVTLGDRDALPSVIEGAALGAQDRELAAHRALALDRAGHDGAIAAIAQALEGLDDVNLRCRLVKALGHLRRAEATALLVETYPAIRSRICVAEALGRAADEAALPFLSARLADEPYTTVRASVARALGQSGTRAAVAPLRKAFQEDTEESVIAAAARALAQLGEAVSVPRRKPLRAPADAKEVWLIPSEPLKQDLRVVVARPRSAEERAIPTAVSRDAYPVPLPEGPVRLRVRTPAAIRFALFR